MSDHPVQPSCPTCRAFEKDLRALRTGIKRLLERVGGHVDAGPANASAVTSKIDEDPVCDRAIRIVHEEYADSKLSLKSISARLYVHEEDSGQLFRQQTGQTFRRYLRGVRIQHAAKLLTGSTEGVKSISGMVGYSDPSHFVRYFQEVTGYTPAEYRRRRSAIHETNVAASGAR